MEQEMNETLDTTLSSVNEFIQPLQREAEAIVEKIENFQTRLSQIANTLQALQQRAANVE